MNDDEKIKVAILEEKIQASKDNLKLQATEYERRLSELNHEAERLRKMQETYVDKTLYATQYKYLSEKIEAVARIVYIGLGVILALQVYFRLKGG